MQMTDERLKMKNMISPDELEEATVGNSRHVVTSCRHVVISCRHAMPPCRHVVTEVLRTAPVGLPNLTERSRQPNKKCDIPL